MLNDRLESVQRSLVEFKMQREYVRLIIIGVQCILALILNIIVYFMYRSCYNKEVDVYTQVNSTLDAICIQNYEISQPVKEFLFWSYLPQFSDKMMMSTGFWAFKLYQDPFGIAYNVLIYYLLTDKQEYLVGNLTFCGDPVQEKIRKIPGLLNDARSTHFYIAVLTVIVVIINIVWNILEWVAECARNRKLKKEADDLNLFYET